MSLVSRETLDQMAALAFVDSKVHKLAGNQTLILDEPDTVWIVKQGGLEILSSRIEDRTPMSLRRHLFRLSHNRATFGCLPDESAGHLGLMAVATDRTELVEISFRQVFTEAISILEDHLKYLDEWVRQLGRVMAEGHVAPSTMVRNSEPGTVEVGKKEVFAADHDETLLVRVDRGDTAVFGMEDLVLAEGQYVVLGPDLWLEVMSDSAHLTICPLSSPSDNQSLAAGLATMHQLFSRFLKRIGEEEDRKEIERRQASNRLRDLETAEAFDDLAAVLDPVEKFHLKDTPLLTATSAVGAVMGITIHPPAPSEDFSKLNDPIEAIARASRVRWRMIILGPEWWKRDSGPLVGYLGEDREPVALLPGKGGYQIVRQGKRIREPLSGKIRDELAPDAHMLYRSLPSKVPGVYGLLKFTARGRVTDTLLVVAMGVIATLVGMLVPKVTGVLVDSAIPNADHELLYQLAGILFAVGTGTAIFTYVQVMTTVRVSTVAEMVSQAAMWDRLLKFRPDFFRKFSSGDLQMRVNAVGEVNRELNGATMRPLISGVLALLNFLLLWYYSWELAKIAIWIGLAVLLLTLAISHFIRQLSFRLHDLEGNFHGLMVQMIGGVGKIRTAGAEYRAFNHWVSKYTAQLQLNKRIQSLKDVISVFDLALPTVAAAFLFWKAAKLTVGLEITDPKRISIGDFIAFNTAFTLYLTGWSDVSTTLVGVLDTVVKGKRIKPLLDGVPEVPDDATDPGRLKGAIQFENVSFRYVEDGPLILDNVSFQIEPGEFVAFVGPSGSGKSTILRMLLGFEHPEYGRVLFDGQDLAGLDVLALRRQIGSVLQNGRLTAGPVADAVSNNAKITHAEIWDAIADAGMTEDIEKMAMGLHTVVAEGGVNLSGGQRQRLLIARALATRPKIVFFDEATSALDNRTQATVSEAMDRRRVTRVVIAHRLSTIRHADRIFVIDRGRVVQAGSFDELTSQEGLFKNLAARQMV